MGSWIGGVFDFMVCHSSLAQSLGEADESAMEFDDIVLRGFLGSGFVCDLIHRAGGVVAMGCIARCALGGDSSMNQLLLRASFVCGLRRGGMMKR